MRRRTLVMILCGLTTLCCLLSACSMTESQASRGDTSDSSDSPESEDRSSADVLGHDLFPDDASSSFSRDDRILLLNGFGEEGFARKVLEEFESMGYSNVQAGNTLSPADDEKGIAANVIFEQEPSSMAYTADADPDAVAEIAERLRIPDDRVYEEQESGYYHAYFGAHDIVAILGPEQIYNFDFS